MPGENTSEYDDFDVSAVVAEIGAELSPREESPIAAEAPSEDVGLQAPVKVAQVEKPAAETPPVEAPAVNPAVVPGQNSVSKPLPKSWKKDMAPHWEKLPPEVHDYVYAREEDVMRGIGQYQRGNNAWQTLIQPFSPIFQQNPDVNPIQIMQGLMNTHLQLLNPSASPEAKAQIAQKILSEYGIPLSATGITPDVQQLIQENQTLRGELRQREVAQIHQRQAAEMAATEKNLAAVNAFAADPKNEYFNEVGPDILRFVKQGVASDLSAAYDMACWANPAIRAKMLAKQQPSLAPDNTRPRDASGKFINVEPSPDVAPRTKKNGSISSTIDDIVNRHYPAGH